MINKFYEQILGEFDEKDREKVKNAIDKVISTYTTSYCHYINNFLTGAIGIIGCAEKGRYHKKGGLDGFIKDMTLQKERLKKAANVISKLRIEKFENLEVGDYPGDEKYIKLEDKVNGEKNNK